MSTDPNWDRWLFASFSAHFNSGLESDALVYIEGQDRVTNDQKSYYEIRVDGPYITEVGKNRYDLVSEVNILCSANHAVDNDYHRIRRMAGLVASLFTEVHIMKYGDGDDDTGAFLGCAVMIHNPRKHERIQINHFGQIDPNVPLMQATVEGHYKLTLEGNT